MVDACLAGCTDQLIAVNRLEVVGIACGFAYLVVALLNVLRNSLGLSVAAWRMALLALPSSCMRSVHYTRHVDVGLASALEDMVDLLTA